jgi:hypothetical protein
VSEDQAAAQTPEASDEEALLRMLAGPFGGEANNGSLRGELGWDADRFWLIRNRLLENGRVQKAHGGPGGKTILAPTPELSTVSRPEASPVNDLARGPNLYAAEADLYDPILTQIDQNWSRDEGYDSRITRKTALAGSRNTGGKWTRPDICVVAIQKFKFLRDPVFDVISFEVKPVWQITVEGVFEALAHRQYATRAYAVFHTSSKNFDLQPETTRIIALAEQHGVGIILADNPASYDSWVERVKARRWAPDPADLNEFIQRVFPSSDHDEIIKLTK